MKCYMSAKCSDLFSMSIYDDNDNLILNDYSGSVPNFISPEGWGDYVQFDIDLKTGQILNWIVPDEDALEDFIRDQNENKEETSSDDE